MTALVHVHRATGKLFEQQIVPANVCMVCSPRTSVGEKPPYYNTLIHMTNGSTYEAIEPRDVVMSLIGNALSDGGASAAYYCAEPDPDKTDEWKIVRKEYARS